MKYRTLLFDLDGTLTDPMVGITRSAQYALSHWGIEVADLRELCPFIGPPLKDSFCEFYHFSEEQAEKAIVKYREYFATRGMYENVPYEGVACFLDLLLQRGMRLCVATSKPECFARQILEYFNLDHYFDFVGGSTLDGSRSAKGDVVAYVLKSVGITDLSHTLMIGDRCHDVIGAAGNGLDSAGVLWGYGSREELVEAGATYIVASFEELERLLGVSK